MPKSPRIAIVSDPLVQRGGAERVVEALADAFPDAPIFALLYSAETGPARLASRITSSWLGRLPQATKRHRFFLPFYRSAIESFDLSAFDIVVSSHHSVAKGVLTRADQLHVCYCHTPMRALWERTVPELATLPAPLRPAAASLFSHLRVWDAVTADRVDRFVANSTTTQRRIATYYRRESELLHPPIDTEFFTPGGEVGDYYLVASRPVPYKRIDLAIAAAGELGHKLVVVGGRSALSPVPRHVQALGHVTDEELRSLMRGARALLFPQYEDFGMTPLEVNACGRPVVAYGAGGALDTVVEGVTGVLAAEQTVESFTDALRRFEDLSIDSESIRRHALDFNREHFIERMRLAVADAWHERSFSRPSAVRV